MKKFGKMDRGITLIELVIAIFVLSVGSFAAFRTVDQSRRAIGGESARFLAQNVAVNRAEEFRALGLIRGRGLPDRVRQGPYDWSVIAREKPVSGGLVELTINVSTADAPGAVLVAYVSVTGGF